MGATYNWSYRPNVSNKYGLVIENTPDDVKPNNTAYVANWGNNITGNGSRIKPYRTIDYVTSNLSDKIIIIGSGVYRSALVSLNLASGYRFYGDGNVIIDGTLIALSSPLNGTYGSFIYNLKITNWQSLSTYENNFTDCIIKDVNGLNSAITDGGISQYTNCTFINILNNGSRPGLVVGNSGYSIKRCTFYKCNNLVFIDYSNYNYALLECIFVECNVAFLRNEANYDFCLFFRCNIAFRPNGISPTPPNVFYPYTPDGFTKIDTIEDLRNLKMSIFPTAPINFDKSIVDDPKFNNKEIGDVTLAIDSPAKNLSYFGTYIGSYSIAKPLSVNIDNLLSAFDNTSSINLVIDENSIVLDNKNMNGIITTKPIDNTAGRELQKLHTFGVNADRNGEFVDSTSDLSTTALVAGDVVATNVPYLVEVGAITYNGAVYNAGQRFTSNNLGGTFTTSTDGVLREIIEAPARENVEARFSDGGAATIDNTEMLEELAWYYVELNEVDYNGQTYTQGKFIKALEGITSFTGNGLLRKAFSNTDEFSYYEINQKPTSNNENNERTGEIVRGNGDKNFDRTAANVFPISKKFIQLRYTIQHNNLIP